MGTRLELHQKLIEITGNENVYFVKPSKKMKYPATVYELTNDDPTYADNLKYHNKKRYNITYIDTNPDSEIPDKIGELTYCTFDRHFVNDNLHHFVFTLFY